MRRVANARMYSVHPQAALAWKELFVWVSDTSGVELDVVDHAFPLALSDLWSRADLACAFMCGLPFALAAPAPKSVVAPIPAKAAIPGRPFYATRLVVRADSKFFALEETFGARLGYTVEDSHSGYNALRHHLLPYYRQRGATLYRESVGPLVTPQRVLDALLACDIDVGPLDSYALDLMLRHQPELAQRIRIVASTDPAPIPLLVASQSCPDAVIATLQAAFMTFKAASSCADLRDRLCLEGFAPVVADDYRLQIQWKAEAGAAGYAQLG